MKTIGLITTSRADYGIYRPLLKGIASDPELRLCLLVSGMHLSPQYGLTVEEIEADGFAIFERIEVPLTSDIPEFISEAMGLTLIRFAQLFSRWRPDLLVVCGDRFEMFSAALASVPFNIPLVHLGGGDVTIGAIDDMLRHSLTKMSHLHFTNTAEAAHRVRQMGEEPWRVVVSGEPGLDNVKAGRFLTASELEKQHSIVVNQPFLLVTYHPVTLQMDEVEWQINQLLDALLTCGLPIIFTMPNADTGNRVIREKIQKFVDNNSFARVIENLGTDAYFSLMTIAGAMVGNSSSGIVEAASFKLPVVNIGLRQTGRTFGRNVINVGNTKREICDAIRRAVNPEFRKSLDDLENLYATGYAVQRIVERLKSVEINERLLQKRFVNLTTG